MALAGLTSWEQLEVVTPFSRSLLKDLGTPRASAEEKHLRPIAAACGVPYAWFTVPDLPTALDGSEDASLAERVEALEGQISAIRRRLDDQADHISEEVEAATSRAEARLREEAALRERAQQRRERQQGERGSSRAPRRREGEES